MPTSAPFAVPGCSIPVRTILDPFPQRKIRILLLPRLL
jgi:hypothetical protein